MNISILTLVAVFILIAVRKIGHFNIKIWQSMTCGALAVLATGEISGLDALKAIDLNVMLFLFGMFVVGQALVASGYLYALAYHLFNRMTSVPQLVCGILFGAALSSALLMNDTLAIIGTPLVLRLAREHNIHSRLLLLTLAYAITIGSVMSPIGNPQNFLIASQGPLPAPFLTFFKALAIPTLVNLIATYLILRLFYRQQFIAAMPLTHNPVKLLDNKLAKLAQTSLFLLIGLITLNIILSAVHSTVQLKLSHIAIIAALPPILFSPARLNLLKSLDWSTLLFFAAMFVLMSSVWQTGIMQRQVNELHIDLTTIPAIMLLSASLSQLISNVPLVALYLPMLTNPSPESLMALAAGSTIAGNLLILGAASNVIIIQHAEKHEATLGFFEFARIGIPLGFVNLLIYWVWFRCWYD
ncbi:MAG: SLC13 family permease [Methylobacter sp.]|nr:SLC13 family permease [Methylobacter sp.]